MTLPVIASAARRATTHILDQWLQRGVPVHVSAHQGLV